jgi:hypothetical protein
VATGSHLLAFGILNVHFVANQWLINVLEMWIYDQKLIILWNRPWKNPLRPNRMMACFIPACCVLGWNCPYHSKKPLVFLRIWLWIFEYSVHITFWLELESRFLIFLSKGRPAFSFFCEMLPKFEITIFERNILLQYSHFFEKNKKI